MKAMATLEGVTDVTWGRGHPERRQADFTRWDKAEWGAFVADRMADDGEWFSKQAKYPRMAGIKVMEIQVADVLQTIMEVPGWH